MSEYIITRVDSQLVYDASNTLVNGKRVYFRIIQYDEIHYVDVVNMNEKTVKTAIENSVKQRDALAAMGNVPK
jgi:hypothetical protein